MRENIWILSSTQLAIKKIVDNFVENINSIKSWALQTHL